MNNNTINNNINFKANYLTTAKIMKKEMGQMLPQDIQVLEMDLKNKADTEALANIKTGWTGAEFAQILPTSWYSDKVKVYVLSTQKANYAIPNPNDIKAFACCNLDKPNATLKFLQVDPKIINDKDRNLFGLGKGLMHKLAEHWHNNGYKTLDLYATEPVKPFYQKIFPAIQPKECTMDSSTNLILNI